METPVKLFSCTQSLSLSKQIADNFENELKNFVQVCPKEMVDKLNHPISTKTKIQKVS